MEHTTLGRTGVTTSRICLGTMGLGDGPTDDYPWALDEADSEALIDRAMELGITFFDTANTYLSGESERVLGSALAEHDRDEFTVSTKVYHPPSPDPHPNATGLSRKTVEQELTNSLDRLGMETVDLYQIHRWDYDTSVEETVRALDDAVRRGQVRYLGASSMWAYQFAEALHAADRLGAPRFVTMQNHYNPVYREEEREMLPLCDREDVGVVPWSPLARGYLTRPHDEFESTARGAHEETRDYNHLDVYRMGGGPEINARVQELADEKGVTMAQITLAWHLHKDLVDAPVVGTTSIDHLEEAVEATEVDLRESDVEYLEEPYSPLPVDGHE